MSKLSECETRIAELEKVRCKTTSQLGKAVQELMGISESKARILTVVTTVKAMQKARRATPVDTGRARAAWQIGDESVKDYVPGDSQADIVAGQARAAQAEHDAANTLTGMDRFWVANNVPYILLLDAGWSQQHPGGFIETMLGDMNAKLREAIARWK